jgi:hypothetical protein
LEKKINQNFEERERELAPTPHPSFEFFLFIFFFTGLNEKGPSFFFHIKFLNPRKRYGMEYLLFVGGNVVK